MFLLKHPKVQNKLKEIQEAGHYKVPNVFMTVALEADNEIEDKGTEIELYRFKSITVHNNHLEELVMDLELGNINIEDVRNVLTKLLGLTRG